MKKILSIIITVCVLLSAMIISIYAISLSLTTTRITVNGNSYILSNDALEDAINIDAEVAGYIAEFFIEDMIATGTCGWDENTEIVDVIAMYDETGVTPTAYTVELTEGYVVVAAYADVESLIPEWSDAGTPLYENIGIEDNDTILYLGGYEYFVDLEDNTVCDIYGNSTDKDNLVNYVEMSRDVSNLPGVVLENCTINPGIITLSNSLDDPYAHAEEIYGRIDNEREFYLSDYCNLWENYIEFYEDTNGYQNCCVPLCIINIVFAHMNKYKLPLSYYNSNFQSYSDLFRYIADYGIEQGYYNDAPYDQNGGTGYYFTDTYILEALRALSIGTNVVGTYLPTYANIKYHLEDNDLLALRLYNHASYSDNDPQTNEAHKVLCYAYTRLYNVYNGNYKTYLKIADGWESSARYLDLATVISYNETTGDYETNYCEYIRVEVWR